MFIFFMAMFHLFKFDKAHSMLVIYMPKKPQVIPISTIEGHISHYSACVWKPNSINDTTIVVVDKSNIEFTGQTIKLITKDKTQSLCLDYHLLRCILQDILSQFLFPIRIIESIAIGPALRLNK